MILYVNVRLASLFLNSLSPSFIHTRNYISPYLESLIRYSELMHSCRHEEVNYVFDIEANARLECLLRSVNKKQARKASEIVT